MAEEFDPNSSGSSGYITSSTPVTTNVPTSRPFDKAQSVLTVQPTTASEADLTRNYNEMSEPLRRSLAQKLKSAGFDVPVTGKYNAKVRQAFIDSISGLSDEIRLLQKNDPKRLETTKYDLDTYLNDKIGERQASFSEQYKPTKTINVSPATVAANKINDVVRRLLDRDATEAEIAQLTISLNKAEEKNPDVSTPKLVGGSVVYTNTGGLDRDTFLEGLVKGIKSPETGKSEFEVKKSEKESLTYQELMSVARSNGIELGQEQIDFYLNGIRNGKDIDVIKNNIRANARRILPEAVRNQIEPDEDLSITFSSYMSNYAKARGIPLSAVKLNDVIPLAITDKGFADSQQFEKNKIAQPWWDTSPEGISKTITVINDTLKDFGLLGQGVRTA
jgi:hypothetical protein